MANLVNFDPKLKYLDLKQPFNLSKSLYFAYLKVGLDDLKISSNLEFWTDDYRLFIEKVVKEVKETLSANEAAHRIDLTKYKQYLPTPHLIFVAQALYRCYGIEIKQVDAMSRPNVMVVSRNKDNPIFSDSLNYLQQARKKGFLIDYHLRLKDNTFPVHKLLLASKSSFFERLFEGGFKTTEEHVMFFEPMQESSVELLIDYMYLGDIPLQAQSADTVCELMTLSHFYYLEHLYQKCSQCMCETVNEKNFMQFIKYARKCEMKDFESALVQNIKDEVNLNSLEAFIKLARAHEIDGLEEVCSAQIIKKVSIEDSLIEIKELLDLAKEYELQTVRTGCETRLIEEDKQSPKFERIESYLLLACQYELKELQDHCNLAFKVNASLELPKLYTDEIELLSCLKRFLEIADKYALEDIKSTCIDMLIGKIENNCDKILVLAQKFKLIRLEEACINFKKQN